MRTRPEVSEEALMQGYVEGDVGAFQRLFDGLAPSLHGFFTRSVRDATVADDLVQTTFLKLHGARRRWRRGERVRPWVFAIAANVRVDWFRSQGRRLETEALDDDGGAAPDPSSDPGAELGLKERSARVHAAL